MTFKEAVEKMLEGFYVRRPCQYYRVAIYWDDNRAKYQPLRCLPSSSCYYPKLPDVVAEDWEIISGMKSGPIEREDLKDIIINDNEGNPENDAFYAEYPGYSVYDTYP